ncbi:MAG: Tol biopolymer transport system component [Hyphomicrobiaceae bacterium]|jgi:Tol biopolymer transport system component
MHALHLLFTIPFVWLLATVPTAVLAAPDLGVATSLISLSSDGGGNFPSRAPDIDGAGRYVVFESFATNLAAGDENGAVDVFLRDRVTRVTQLLSRGSDGRSANGASSAPAISADGSHVAFVSEADNLVAGDRNGRADIFVFALASGRIEMVTVTANGSLADGDSSQPVLSADGSVVAFVSEATNFVDDDLAGHADVFVRNLKIGRTFRISRGPQGAEALGQSRDPAMDASGEHIAFSSRAPNLVAGDDNRTWDVFVWRDGIDGLDAVSRKRPARGKARGNFGDGASTSPTLSADGRRIAFSTWAGNLVPGAGRRKQSVVYCELGDGSCALVSLDGVGGTIQQSSWDPEISGDGRAVAFFTLSTDAVERAGEAGDVFVRHVDAGVTHHGLHRAKFIKQSATRLQPALSFDGSALAFVAGQADGSDRAKRYDSAGVFVYQDAQGIARCGDFIVSKDEECDLGLRDPRPGLGCTPQCTRVRCGDIDGDGRVRASDANLAMKMAVAGHSCDSRVCDVDRSGGPVSGTDAIKILRHSLGDSRDEFCAPVGSTR